MYDEFNGSNGGMEGSTQPLEPNPQQSQAAERSDINQQNDYDPRKEYYQQGNSSQQGAYTQNAYNNNYYSSANQQQEGGAGFGIASLVLGILSLITFCTLCMNIPLAILAIIFGIIQLVKGNGKGLAIGGLITSVLSIVACIVFYLIIGLSVPKFSDLMDMDSYMQQYPELYQRYYDSNDFDYDDFFNDNYDHNDDTF